MGGAIFPNTARLSPSQYEAFQAHVLNALTTPPSSLDTQPNSSFLPSSLSVPKHFTKASFGDIDVVAGPTGWDPPKDGSASWEGQPEEGKEEEEQGSKLVDDGVGGRTRDWTRRLKGLRWKRNGPIISFAVPLSSFLPPTPDDLSAPSQPSTSSPTIAQVDLILVSSPSQVAFQAFLLSYSGLSLLLALPLHRLAHRQIIFGHGSLTLVHNFPNPPDSVELFGTSSTVPLPSLELSLSSDVEEICRLFGLNWERWSEMEGQGDSLKEEDLFIWVLGTEEGLLRKGWERVLETSEILDVSTNDEPLLSLVSRDSSRSRKTNSKQRSKLKIPLFQSFLRWFQTHPLPPRSTTSSPTPSSSSQSSTPLPSPFSLLNPTTFLVLQSLPSRLDLYISTLAARQAEIDALLLRRRTNLALSGTKVLRWIPDIDPGQTSRVTDSVRLKARALDGGGEGWLGAEGRREEEVRKLAVESWEEIRRAREANLGGPSLSNVPGSGIS